MAALWYVLLVSMLAGYLVLDGFDLGAGALHLFLGKNQSERQLLLRAIGPHWDGNEVWLIAAGGTLFFAFPAAYAAAFSGFYLPLTLVLWLLILRGIGVEFRGHLDDPLWQAFWDVIFSVASSLLAIVLGAALGNVLRGVPLDTHGHFFVPLWTDFRTGPALGALDWYTVALALLAYAALAAHGARFLALRTEGALQARARRLGALFGWAVGPLTVFDLWATAHVRPDDAASFGRAPWALLGLGAALVGWIGGLALCARRRDGAAFLASALYLLGMFASVAIGIYPNLLPAPAGASGSLGIAATAAPEATLRAALTWWLVGMAIALVYVAATFRIFRGKVESGGGKATERDAFPAGRGLGSWR